MSEADEALEWVKYAEEDLIMAKSALRRSKPLTIGSCFHPAMRREIPQGNSGLAEC